MRCCFDLGFVKCYVDFCISKKRTEREQYRPGSLAESR